MRWLLSLNAVRSSAVCCRQGVKTLCTTTPTSSSLLESRSLTSLIPHIELRAFQSFGLPQQKSALKSKKKQSQRRWQSNPLLDERFVVILKKALHGSVNDAVVDFNQMSVTFSLAFLSSLCNLRKQACNSNLPDWMVVKISSVLVLNGDWQGAKQLLDAQYLSTGADQRFARNASVEEHQVLSAVERILQGDKAQSYDMAKIFYTTLIDLRFCACKDSVLKSLMQFLINRNEVERAVEEFSGLLASCKPKSISGALFVVMRAAYRTDTTLMDKVNDLMKRSVKSKLQATCLLGCVLLAERRPLQFAQYLHDEERAFGEAEVQYVCEFAVHNKEVVILESLTEMPEVFHLDEKARAAVYASMASCYGKGKDVEGLYRVVRMVASERRMEEFAVTVHKLIHFCSCLNVVPPQDLVALSRTLNE